MWSWWSNNGYLTSERLSFCILSQPSLLLPLPVFKTIPLFEEWLLSPFHALSPM